MRAENPTGEDEALLTLLRQLSRCGYRFVTPTPATHARVIARSGHHDACDLRDVLGWSKAFRPDIVEPEILKSLVMANAIEELAEGRMKCRYRVSSLGDDLFLHSAYPTEAEDAVFFGPDSYRFAELIRSELPRCPPRGETLVDIGAGAGVGAIVAARLCPDLRIHMTDINPRAARFAAINARAAGVSAEIAIGSGLASLIGPVAVALANPPYIIDPKARDYRDGGGMHGARVSYDMAAQALPRLTAGARFILYTGSAIISGHDPLRKALTELAARYCCAIRYWEIDPDVFGEELEKDAYADVERIAIVGAVMTRSA